MPEAHRSPFCYQCGALYPDRAQVRVELARMIRQRVKLAAALPPAGVLRNDPRLDPIQDLDVLIDRVARELRLTPTMIGREFDRAWRSRS